MSEPSHDVDDLIRRAADLAISQRRPMRNRLDRARRADEPGPRIAEIAVEIAAAEQLLERRRERLPRPTFPAELPITERVDELIAAIAENQVVVVAGETGSGKSTQLPKICLAMGRGVDGLIGHTQPRRIAARTVAERVAEELECDVGDAVGYAVRFTDKVGPETNLKLMTDGILLAEVQRDRYLTAYDTIIIDEAHERSLNIDFLLGYLHQLLPKRPDLKLIITSATIDTERFSEHFGGAPIIEVSGRTFPVEHRYQPLDDQPVADAIADAVTELLSEAPTGDVLVFCAGERDIREAIAALEHRRLGVELLPLYARLSVADQHKVFKGHKGRRVVVSTNVAETSLTVPGIRYVVDPGLARISRFGRRTKVQRLPIEPISQASANQRSGRCGRVAPGICIRLFDEDDFEAREEFTEPEILRTNLASVILQMTALGLGVIEEFPFVEPPDNRSIGDGVNLLVELGALDPDKEGTKGWLTTMGKRLARLPLDPRIGRMVLAAEELDCVGDVIVIAAALSVRDPRERPRDGAGSAANASHRRFDHPDSDLLSWLELWDHLRRLRSEHSSNQFRRRCREEHLNYVRIREWQDTERQIRETARRVKIDIGRRPNERSNAHQDAIHQAILTGLVSQIGQFDPEAGDYKGTRNTRFRVGRESALAKKPPKWIMVAEMVDTGQVWARGVARIQPAWLELAAPHLVKRRRGEALWDPEREEAVVNETITLYGIQIVPRRTVALSRYDEPAARDIFLHHGLVEDDWAGDHPFVDHNRSIIEELEAHEHRARRSLITDHHALFDFYDARVGEEVTSGASFDQWWASVRGREPELLHASLGLLLDAEDQPDEDEHPTSWNAGSFELDLSYVFQPGAIDDGVTLRIPVAHLNQVNIAGLDWQVPGLRLDLVTALIRTLPKPIRRQITPVQDRAEEFVASREPDGRPLVVVLAEFLAREAGQPVRPDDLDLERVTDHLRVRFAAIDEEGRELASSVHLDALQAEMAPDVREVLASVGSELERTGLVAWTIGDLPRVVEADQRGVPVTAHPALNDEGESVGVALFETRAQQLRSMWSGTRRLLRLSVPSATRVAHSSLTSVSQYAPLYRPHETLRELLDDIIDAGVSELMGEHGAPAWNESDFETLRLAVRADLPDRVRDIGTTTGKVLLVRGHLASEVDASRVDPLAVTVADIDQQVAALIRPGFVSATGREQLAHLERYLEAARHRLTKARTQPGRDHQLLAPVRRLENEVSAASGSATTGADARTVRELRWMLEEYRVSQFAQHLGTAQPVSESRIRKLLAELG